jgi:hypothetical protein
MKGERFIELIKKPTWYKSMLSKKDSLSYSKTQMIENKRVKEDIPHK